MERGHCTGKPRRRLREFSVAAHCGFHRGNHFQQEPLDVQSPLCAGGKERKGCLQIAKRRIIDPFASSAEKAVPAVALMKGKATPKICQQRMGERNVDDRELLGGRRANAMQVVPLDEAKRASR